MTSYRQVDKGWAWVCLVACLLSNILNGTLYYGSNILFVVMLREYGETVASTALVGSVFTGVMCFSGPFATVIVKTSSCRVAMVMGGLFTFIGCTSSFFVRKIDFYFITYGIITAMGSGLVAAASFTNAGFSFLRYQGLACGVVVAGNGCGMLLSGPVMHALVSTYGLHGAFLLIGGLCSHEIVFGMLLRPSQLERMHHTQKRKRKYEDTALERRDYLLSKDKSEETSEIMKTLISVFKHKSFSCILVATVIWHFAMQGIFLHLPNYAIQKGETTGDAAFLMTIIGLGGTTSRFLTGLAVGKQNGIDVLHLEFGLLAISGVLTILFPLLSCSSAGTRVYCFLFGLYSGGLITLFAPLAIELLGLSNLPAGIGAFMFSGGIGSIAGPPVIGYIVDTWHTYENSFYLAGIGLVLSSGIVLIGSVWREHPSADLGNTTDCDTSVTIDKVTALDTFLHDTTTTNNTSADNGKIK